MQPFGIFTDALLRLCVQVKSNRSFNSHNPETSAGETLPANDKISLTLYNKIPLENIIINILNEQKMSFFELVW